MTLTLDETAHSKPILLIIELDYHAEVLTALCPILSQQFQLRLWVTDKIRRKIALPDASFERVYEMPKKNSPRTYLAQQTGVFDGVDLIYFNTLESHFKFWAQCHFPCPSIVRLHNVNASLFPLQSIDWQGAKWWLILRYFLDKVLLHRYWHFRSLIYRKVNYLMMPGPAIADEVSNKHPTHPYKNISPYSLPFYSLGDYLQASPSDVIEVAVCGSVDPQRKDYALLEQAIQLYKEKQQHPLRLTFLGGPKGKPGQQVIERFKSLEGGSFVFEAAAGYVPQKEVDEKMLRTHFLIAPINLKTQHKIFVEYYGQSKISGIEIDMVQYCKPALLPADYRLPQNLHCVSGSYCSAEELYQKLVEWGGGQQWQSLSEQYRAMSELSKEAIAKQFYGVYQSLTAAR